MRHLDAVFIGLLWALMGVAMILLRRLFAARALRMLHGFNLKRQMGASARRNLELAMAGFGLLVVIVGIVMTLRGL